MANTDFHYIDIDGVLVEQPVRYEDYDTEESFPEAVKKMKKIPTVIDRIKKMEGLKFFCTGRKESSLGAFTYDQLREMFPIYNDDHIQLYPEDRKYKPWEIYNMFKLIILEIEYSKLPSINKIYVWEDSIWVIQAIIKYTTIPLEQFIFKYVHKNEGEYYVSEINPEEIDALVVEIESRLEK